MLLLAILLHGATAAMPPVATDPRPAQTRKVRRGAKPKRRSVAYATRINLLQRCADASCGRDPNAKYRIDVSTASYDGKTGAVESTGMPCGVTGAPVCPRNGMTVLTAPLSEPGANP